MFQSGAFSKLELSALLGSVLLTDITPSIVSLPLETVEAAQELLKNSGGMVKISQLISQHPKTLTSEELEELLVEDLALQAAPIDFSVTILDQHSELEVNHQRIKLELKARGLTSRYRVDSKSSSLGLSAAIMLHHKVSEYLIVTDAEHIFVTRTVAFQDIDDWTKRDRSKPYADRKKGMLPPKVARMLVNIGIGTFAGANQRPAKHLYDPFCGTGTVLLEGSMRGLRVTGSDVSGDATRGTEENLHWLMQEYGLNTTFQAVLGDVTSSKTLAHIPQPIDIVVTEPFMGRPSPPAHQLGNIFKGLEKLYIGAFKNLASFLSEGSVVVFIMPEANVGKAHHDLHKLIDKISQFGYTMASPMVSYARPEATIERTIYTFIFHKAA